MRIKSICFPLFIAYCLLGAISVARAAKRPCRIVIIHSYERNYHDADRYRTLLKRELSANGLNAQMRELFLNCDELTYHNELARASFFIDEAFAWGADAIAVFNNQAVFSLLKCGNEKVRDIPVVFSGVYFPDEELIGQFPNVNGYVDIPDYVRTVRMIERVVGKSRIVVMSGSGTIDGHMWSDLVGQCSRAGIETYDGDAQAHIWRHRVVKDPDKEDKGEFYNEQIDTTVVMRLMSESMPLRTIQQTARGSETYLMLTSRTYNSLDAPNFFVNPSFAVINEGFGSNSRMLGGYFVPLETQIREMARGIAGRLRRELPERQIVQCRKEYVLDWKVMQRYGIETEGLPPEYRVMYVPVTDRYRSLLIAGCLLAGIGLILLFVYLTHGLARESRRRRETLRDLLFEHETLKLAIEGGTTYAWRIKEGRLSFDSHFYTLIGHPKKSITLEQIISFIHPDDKARFVRNFRWEGQHAGYKGEYRCSFSGEYRWWEFRYSLVFGSGHAPVVTGLLQDIQEMKDYEAQLIQARQLAERAELKQSFLNNVSHEIRTPLNAIVGFSNLLIENPDLSEEDKQEFIRLINLNNHLLLKLIGDILELSRIESGTVGFAVEECSLRSLLESFYQTFGMQVKAGLAFERDFPEQDVTVQVDPMRLQQVISNFLTNANKFTERGFIRLGYRVAEGEVRIFVEDSGKGIPADVLQIIFNRFYKHDEFAQGTGLGLSICHSIVERMNGRIDVESKVGEGSRFTVVLPLEGGGISFTIS